MSERIKSSDLPILALTQVGTAALGVAVYEATDRVPSDGSIAFRNDPEIARHGGFPAFWQEHGGDFGNGIVDSVVPQLFLLGISALASGGRISYRTLAAIRIIAMAVSISTILMVELRPLSDMLHTIFGPMSARLFGTPDLLDIPAGVAGSTIPAGVDTIVAAGRRRRARRRR